MFLSHLVIVNLGAHEGLKRFRITYREYLSPAFGFNMLAETRRPINVVGIAPNLCADSNSL